MDASELRDQLLEKQRELAARHKVLSRLDPEPDRVEPDRVEPDRVEPDRVEPDRVEPDRVDSQRADSQRAEPERADSQGADSQRAEPERADSQRADSQRGGSERAEPQPAEPERYGDQLVQVFDATNDLIVVLDLIDARAVRRRTLAAAALLGLVFVLAAFVAAGVLPAYWLIGALLVLTAAVTLWLTTRDVAEAQREATA